MSDWKKRYLHLKKRVGGASGHHLMHGAKDSVKELGAGAAGAAVAVMVARFLPVGVPLVTPLALAAAGHFLRKKMPDLSAGMLGAAGALALQEVLGRNPGLTAKLTSFGATSQAAPPQATGFEITDVGAFQNAGALDNYAGAGALGMGNQMDAGAFQNAGAFEDAFSGTNYG